MADLIDWMIETELVRFVANDYRGRTDATEFELIAGTIPVMVSAPHAVTHWRDGRVKPSDDYTGSLALALARLTGCHALVATRFAHADPNWDPLEQSAYKQALVAHARAHDIRLVIDLHGMVAASPVLVALGTADGETAATWPRAEQVAYQLLCEQLAPLVERYGKGVDLNGYRAARGENTVTRTVSRTCGIAAMQVELATQLRIPSTRGMHIPEGEPVPFGPRTLATEIATRQNADPKAVELTVQALATVIERLDEAHPGATEQPPAPR